MKKSIDVAIIGLGARGGDVYGPLINNRKDEFNIVALCDKRTDRLKRFAIEFGVDKKNCFLLEEEFFKEKRADFLVIATPDLAHIGHLYKAMPLGYDILVEKPVCEKEEDCKKLLSLQKKYSKKVFVCHVIRYAPAFVKLGELLARQRIGKLISVDALERVEYAHYSHSYVRGNWRNTDVAMPMILAKCCHDLDLIQYYAGAKCVSVSSIGENTFFNKENAPDDSADRCLNCKYADDCVFSAKKIYLDRWENASCPTDIWPFNVIAEAPLTEEKIIIALKTGDYGRCVFKCDNNVVDHQITLMNFANGVKATLNMSAFTNYGGRRYAFFGTEGEIIYDEQNDSILVRRFGEAEERVKLADFVKD
ncbi:MAG: Gfo/Idh/MocA family oxidoreductase, partial [Clostridia bacterium]|nr:Gfo/Idh/MocA family oxidoreductase [Clostridia bacterium]